MVIKPQYQYGQLSGSKKINETIYACFEVLDQSEELKFVRKFREQPHDNIQIMHTFRELILGAYISKSGFDMCHDCEIESKTPDWSILNDNSHPQCIIELVNFHTDAETTKDIAQQIKDKGIWCNFTKPNIDRLYQVIWAKSSKYKRIVQKLKIPYIVSVFGDFQADVEMDEIKICLFGQDGLFKIYPEVSGLLYFEESSGSYYFKYFSNPDAEKPIAITDGSFP